MIRQVQRYKKKNLQEAACDSIATAMESDGILVYLHDVLGISFHFATKGDILK